MSCTFALAGGDIIGSSAVRHMELPAASCHLSCGSPSDRLRLRLWLWFLVLALAQRFSSGPADSMKIKTVSLAVENALTIVFTASLG